MPRIKTIRKVVNPPCIKGFKPYGSHENNPGNEPVNLLFEEYEALRLSDYDGLNHHQASVMMGVSRPTFTRIYAASLQKIAKAFVEGRQISITGGKVYFDSDWYECRTCTCHFNNPDRHLAVDACPLCGSHAIGRVEGSEGPEPGEWIAGDAVCYCPGCGYEQHHINGQPCHSVSCPECSTPLVRKQGGNRHRMRKGPVQ